jgi:membrane associated rhomboid family serine protease
VFILPLNEDGYIGRRAYVLLGLVVLNALALAATYILPASSDAVFQQYGFVPAHPHLSTLLSWMFLHTGFWHLAGNIFFLWMFGLPRGEYLRPLAICGALHHWCGATALHYLFNSASDIPCVGASGAISGIVGCYLMLFPRSRFEIVVVFFWWPIKTIETYTYGAIGAWIGEQAILALLTQAVRFSSVAFWAHIGGFLTGAALTWLLLLVAPQLRRRGEQPPVVRFVRGIVRDTTGKPVADARFEIDAYFASYDLRVRIRFDRHSVVSVAVCARFPPKRRNPSLLRPILSLAVSKQQVAPFGLHPAAG